MAKGIKVVVNDWTVKTSAGLFGIRRVEYSFRTSFGSNRPVQKATEVHLGPIGETNGTVAGGVIALGAVLFFIFYARRSKLDPPGTLTS